MTGQTDYDNETALDRLQECEYDPLTVIRNFMNPNKDTISKSVPEKTTNQKMFQEMRYMLDEANATYRRKKELEESQ